MLLSSCNAIGHCNNAQRYINAILSPAVLKLNICIMHTFRFLVLLSVSLVLTASVSLAQSNEDNIPQTYHDPDLNREARKEYKEGRRKWMEGMHRADPGVNVAVINREIRRAKRALREKNEHTILANDASVQITTGLSGHWNERGSNNQAGRTLAADIDYQTGKVYVAADGGQIWRGTLEGTDWTPLNDNDRFERVRMLRIVRTPDRFRIVVVHSSSVRYSDDGGNTWLHGTGLDDIQRSGSFQRAILTNGPAHILYAIGQEWDFDESKWTGVLYRSQDQGATFTKLFRFEDRRSDVWAPYGEDFSYVLYGDTLLGIEPDGTQRIIAAPMQFADGTLNGSRQLDLRGNSGAEMYLLSRRNQTETFVSADSGKNWVRTGATPSLFDRNSFDVSPYNSGFAIVGGIEAMSTRDAGFEWDVVNEWGAYYARPASRLHADIPFIKFFIFPDETEKILISTDGGLYISEDSLQTVRNLSLSGMGNSQYYSVYTSRVDTNYIFAGSQDQGFQRTTVDDGSVLDFVQTLSGDYGHISTGDNGKSLWTNYPGFSMHYSNALKEDLRRGGTMDFPTQGHLWLPPIIADPDTPNVAYLAGGGTQGGAHLIKLRYFSTGDIQAEELPFDFAQGGNRPINAVAISPVNTDLWYVITNDNRFYVSSNRGQDWELTEEFEGLGGHYFYGANIVPSKQSPGLLYVAGSGYSGPGVWVSRDNGQTFEPMDNGLPPTLVFDIDATEDDRMLFAATAVGPYVYLADSNKWFDAAGTVAPDQTYWSVDYISENNLARFGTFGRGIWDLRLEKTVTSVERIQAPQAGESMLLSGTSRSNSATEFLLTMPQQGNVNLRVYDLSGKIVAVLHSGMLEAGEHRFYWDGNTVNGTHSPSGRYFCVAAGFGTVAYATTSVER